MKGSIADERFVEKVNKAEEAGGKFNKIEMGKNYIRLWSLEAVSEFVHGFDGEGKYTEGVCLGGIQDGHGYAPDDCPVCAEAKIHWDRRKELMSDPNWEKDRRKKAEVRVEYDIGMDLQTKQKTVVIALKGSPVMKDGRPVVVWEKQVKYLSLTLPQWKKLTKEIFKKYPQIVKSADDLLNRTLMFVKKDKEGRKATGKYTEVDIIPALDASPAPQIEGEIPAFDDLFPPRTADELRKMMNDYLGDLAVGSAGQPAGPVKTKRVQEAGTARQVDPIEELEEAEDPEDVPATPQTPPARPAPAPRAPEQAGRKPLAQMPGKAGPTKIQAPAQDQAQELASTADDFPEDGLAAAAADDGFPQEASAADPVPEPDELGGEGPFTSTTGGAGGTVKG